MASSSQATPADLFATRSITPTNRTKYSKIMDEVEKYLPPASRRVSRQVYFEAVQKHFAQIKRFDKDNKEAERITRVYETIERQFVQTRNARDRYVSYLEDEEWTEVSTEALKSVSTKNEEDRRQHKLVFNALSFLGYAVDPSDVRDIVGYLHNSVKNDLWNELARKTGDVTKFDRFFQDAKYASVIRIFCEKFLTYHSWVGKVRAENRRKRAKAAKAMGSGFKRGFFL